jgi:hypothetical protein
MDVCPLPGVALKSFTSCDCTARWGGPEIHSAATVVNAKQFLQSVLVRTPFPIRAFQVDGGSEFKYRRSICERFHDKIITWEKPYE